MFLLHILKKGAVFVNLTEIKSINLQNIFLFYKLGLLCKNVEDYYGVFDPENFNT